MTMTMVMMCMVRDDGAVYEWHDPVGGVDGGGGGDGAVLVGWCR